MAPPVTTSRDWRPSPATVQAMDALRTAYTRAPLKRDVPSQYSGATRTQYPIGAGTRILRNYIAEKYGIRTTYMPGRSRPMLPTQRLDQHQWGHAIDFMLSDVPKGTQIAEELVSLGDSIGLQYIVFAGNRFDVGQRAGSRFAAYEGTNKHRDHIHMELSTDGAAARTPWFSGRSQPTAATLLADASGPTPPIGDAGEGYPALTWVGVAAGGVAVVGGGIALARRIA